MNEKTESSFAKIITDEQIKSYNQSNLMTFTPSRFGFLLAHRGIRPMSLHILLASSGIGKTSLLQSIVSDSAEQDDCLVFCTEETTAEWQIKLKKSNPLVNMEKLTFLHSSKAPVECLNDVRAYVNWLCTKMVESEARIVFIDNLTTDLVYQNCGTKQSLFITELLKFCKRTKKSIFAIAHTANEFKNGTLLEGSHIRGNKAAHNMAEFFYCMQSFTRNGIKFVYVKNDKYRGFEVNTPYWVLEYRGGQYVKDHSVQFDKISEAFNKRDKL